FSSTVAKQSLRLDKNKKNGLDSAIAAIYANHDYGPPRPSTASSERPLGVRTRKALFRAETAFLMRGLYYMNVIQATDFEHAGSSGESGFCRKFTFI
ncbi:MAG: hypothetical protein VZQ80_11355, partial [Lachnospiraceae bacterium]|nr:hypothetical protein [Lachnospiraceae bacterium]